MRKKNILLVVLMALMAINCSRDEPMMSIRQDANTIEFGTYVGRDAMTRASVTNIEALQVADVGFGVFAHYSGAAAYATPTTTPNFMYNQQVKWKAAVSKWEYTPVKYWPNNSGEKVSFFAFAPYGNANITIASAAVGDPTLKFTVNGTVKDQADLVWGVNETGGLPFLNQTKQTVTEDIKFTFKHALARIGFNVEAMVDLVNDEATGDNDTGTPPNGDIATDTKIVVTKVELIGNFYESGVLNLNSTVTTGTSIVSVPNWGTYLPATVTERTFTLNAGTDATASNFASAESVGPHTDGKTFGQDVTNAKKTLNKADSYIMVIPQNFTLTDKIKITVTYDVITKDASLNTGQSKVTNVITSDEFAFNFEHGKAYTFNLHLGMTSVKFDVTVTPWNTTEPETVVNVPINTVKIEAPSNSYIVAPNSLGIYIPVSIANASMLGEQLDVADDFTAELIWTDNENKIADNSNIAEIGTGRQDSAGYLFVKPGSAQGNAVVAIKNADNKIVWSWHIWVTNQKPTSIGMFMDRNLGAIGNTPGAVGTLGLLYQWGRKDPFPSSATIDSNTEPVVYNGSGVITISKTATTAPNNFGNSVANPFTFYLGAGANGNDWFSSSIDTHDNTLWGYRIAKTVYDPCPEGWRVPEKDDHENYVMPALGVWETNNIGRTNSTYGGFYPAAGSRGSDDGSLKNLPSTSWGNPYRAYYWSSRATNVTPNSFNFGKGYQNTYNESGRAAGFSVRCVKE